MVGYVANPALCEVVKDVRDQLVGFEIDEAFFIEIDPERALSYSGRASYQTECGLMLP